MGLEDEGTLDTDETPEGGAPASEESAERKPAPPKPPAPTAPAAPPPTRLVSDAALTDTKTPPDATPTEEDRIAKNADRYVRMAGGDPSDPAATQRALDKALSDNNRLAKLSRERDAQAAVIDELRSRVQSLESRRDDYVPPPVEVDPDDDTEVNAIANRLVTQHPEAKGLIERWQSLKAQRDKVAERDQGGSIVGGDLYTLRNDIADIQSNLDEKRRERLGLPGLSELDREGLEARLEKLQSKEERLVGEFRRLSSDMDRQSERYNDLKRETADRVRSKATQARAYAAERARAPQMEAEAEAAWDDSFEAVAARLSANERDLLETHLLHQASYVLKDDADAITPTNVNAWMARESQRYLRKLGVASGRGDVAYAREKAYDSRQPAPIGRASLAIPDRSEKVTAGDRLRAANRRASSMSRSIRAR